MPDQAHNPTTATLTTVRLKKPGSQPDKPEPEFFSLQDILHFLKRNLVTIAAPIALALLAAAVYVVLTKPIYRADAQLLIDANFPHIFREQMGEARALLDSAQVESQMAILRSEHLALAVIRKMNLLAPSDAAESARDAPGTTNANGEADYKKLRGVIEAFHEGLRVRRVGPSYVIEVSYHSTDPEKAAQIANATVQAYIDDQLTIRAEAARQGSRWLEGRIEELRLQMNAAALKVQEFKVKRDYRIISKPESGPPVEQPTATPKMAQTTFEELESAAQTYRKIYESYLQAHTESVQRQSFPVSNARVITRATSVKSHPKVTLLLSLAVVAGAFVGLGIALIGEPHLPLALRRRRVG